LDREPAGFGLKFEVSHGYYLVRDWEDVFSFRVCVPKERVEELSSSLFYENNRLKEKGKLNGMLWLDDQEHKTDGLVCITRRWVSAYNSIYISTL